MSGDPKTPGWFQKWLGKDDVVDQVVTVEDFEQPDGDDPTYVVEFERVGRIRNVAALTTTARSANELAAKIYRHTRPHLGSNAVHVDVDLDELRGFIMAGFRSAGAFTITAGGES